MDLIQQCPPPESQYAQQGHHEKMNLDKVSCLLFHHQTPRNVTHPPQWAPLRLQMAHHPPQLYWGRGKGIIGS